MNDSKRQNIKLEITNLTNKLKNLKKELEILEKGVYCLKLCGCGVGRWVNLNKNNYNSHNKLCYSGAILYIDNTSPNGYIHIE